MELSKFQMPLHHMRRHANFLLRVCPTSPSILSQAAAEQSDWDVHECSIWMRLAYDHAFEGKLRFIALEATLIGKLFISEFFSESDYIVHLLVDTSVGCEMNLSALLRFDNLTALNSRNRYRAVK